MQLNLYIYICIYKCAGSIITIYRVPASLCLTRESQQPLASPKLGGFRAAAFVVARASLQSLASTPLASTQLDGFRVAVTPSYHPGTKKALFNYCHSQFIELAKVVSWRNVTRKTKTIVIYT